MALYPPKRDVATISGSVRLEGAGVAWQISVVCFRYGVSVADRVLGAQ